MIHVRGAPPQGVDFSLTLIFVVRLTNGFGYFLFSVVDDAGGRCVGRPEAI